MMDNNSQWGLTYLPHQVRNLFRGMPGAWRDRHKLVFCWFIMVHLVVFGPRTLTRLSKAAPNFITEWRFRRLLSAGYWSLRLLMKWFAEETIKCLPEPKDKIAYAVADGSKKDKRGDKNPAAQKGRMSEKKSWFFLYSFCGPHDRLG